MKAAEDRVKAAGRAVADAIDAEKEVPKVMAVYAVDDAKAAEGRATAAEEAAKAAAMGKKADAKRIKDEGKKAKGKAEKATAKEAGKAADAAVKAAEVAAKAAEAARKEAAKGTVQAEAASKKAGKPKSPPPPGLFLPRAEGGASSAAPAAPNAATPPAEKTKPTAVAQPPPAATVPMQGGSAELEDVKLAETAEEAEVGQKEELIAEKAHRDQLKAKKLAVKKGAEAKKAELRQAKKKETEEKKRKRTEQRKLVRATRKLKGAQKLEAVEAELNQLCMAIDAKYVELKAAQLTPAEKQAYKTLYPVQQKADTEIGAQVSLVTDVTKRLNQSIFFAQSQLNTEMVRGGLSEAFQKLRRSAFEFIRKKMRLSSIAKMGFTLDVDVSDLDPKLDSKLNPKLDRKLDPKLDPHS